VPLVLFTGQRRVMGRFVSPAWLRVLAWGITAIIVGLNVTLLYGMI